MKPAARRQLRALKAPLGALPSGGLRTHTGIHDGAAVQPCSLSPRRLRLGPGVGRLSGVAGPRSARRSRQLGAQRLRSSSQQAASNPTALHPQPPAAPQYQRRGRRISSAGSPLAPLHHQHQHHWQPLNEARKWTAPVWSSSSPGPNHMERIKSASRLHSWHWNEADKSHECIVSEDKLEVCFHPQCSESAAAIRGTQPLIQNGNYYYWEVTVLDRTYGTSVMFGLCTKNQQLHANDYCNLIGLDQEGWSLSHKGLIWHNKKNAQYSQMFPPNQSVTIGLLFNTMQGQLSYFMNGKDLGVAFTGLNDVESELYPVIGSTAKRTRIRLNGAYCGYVSLMERSCFTLLKNSHDKIKLLQTLQMYQVPRNLIAYLAEVGHVCCGQTQTTALQSV